MIEDVVDVVLTGCRVREVEIPWRVGRPDHPEVVAPRTRNDEQQALLGLGDQTGLRFDPVTRDDNVHTLGGRHTEGTLAADHLLDLVGPDAGGVDGPLGVHVDLVARFEVLHPRSDNLLAVSEQPDDSRAGRNVRAVGRRGASDHHRVPGVVELALVELDGPVNRLALPAGETLQRLAPAHVLVMGRDALPRAENVVHPDSRSDVGAVDAAPFEGVDELDGPGQVRAERVQDQRPLAQCLEHQMEVELLEITQTAVHQFRGTTGRAGGHVARLDQADGQPPAGGVQGGAGADDAGSDHQDVQLCRGKVFQCLGPAGRTQRGGGETHRIGYPFVLRRGCGELRHDGVSRARGAEPRSPRHAVTPWATRVERSGSCWVWMKRIVPDLARMDSDQVLIRPVPKRTPLSRPPSVTPVAAKKMSSPPTRSLVVRILLRSYPWLIASWRSSSLRGASRAKISPPRQRSAAAAITPSGVPPVPSSRSTPVSICSTDAAMIAPATSPSGRNLIRAPVPRIAATRFVCLGRSSTATVRSSALRPNAFATEAISASTGASGSTAPAAAGGTTVLRM